MDRHARQLHRPLYGGLLILGVVAVALLIFFLEDLVGMFDRTYTVVALVPDAPGLAAGSPVWVGGKAVGEVKQVGFMPPDADTLGRVWVTMSLPVSVQTQVRVDSRVRLTSASLIGERVVNIVPGSPDARIVTPGDTLRTRVGPTAEGVTRRAAELRGELNEAISQLRELSPLVETRMERTRQAFAQLDGVMAEARRIRADMQTNPGAALLRDPAFSASLERAQQHAADIPAAVARLGDEYRGAGDVAAALARLQARADTLGGLLDSASAMLDSPVGFAGRSRQDDALRTAVEAARASLDSLMVEVRGNPLRFVF